MATKEPKVVVHAAWRMIVEMTVETIVPHSLYFIVYMGLEKD
jgi:hypothetical protein